MITAENSQAGPFNFGLTIQRKLFRAWWKIDVMRNSFLLNDAERVAVWISQDDVVRFLWIAPVDALRAD